MIAVKRRPGRPAQTHCIRGHEFVAGNVRIRKDSQGYVLRVCRLCDFIRYKNRLISNAAKESS